MHRFILIAVPPVAAPQHGLAADSYAARALRRRFDDLDGTRDGMLDEAEARAALGRLGMPAGEADGRRLLRRIAAAHQVSTDGVSIGSGGAVAAVDGVDVDQSPAAPVSCEQFAAFAVGREAELLDAFRALDMAGEGYLSDRTLLAALRREGYRRATLSQTREMLRRAKTGSGAFSKGGGLLAGSAGEAGGFASAGRAIDFAEFRDFLLLGDANTARECAAAWGRACLQVADAEAAFPMAGLRASVPARSGWDAAKHLAAGAIAGGVSRSAVAPMERVKIEYMLDSSLSTKEGFVGTLRRILSQGGPVALFRGNSLNVARIAPTKAVEFFVFDALKGRMLARRDATITGNTATADLSGAERMVGGSLASMAGTAVTHPIDTLRSRVTAAAGNVTPATALRALVQNEGWCALYKGFWANMLRVAPYGAINFWVYDSLKTWNRSRLVSRGEARDASALETMAAGAAAGAAAQTAVYPLEMIQRRMQVQGVGGRPVLYTGVAQGIAKVAREEGIGALWRGLAPNYTKILPAAAISFYVYEVLKRYLDL